jgi:hypothetical protein
LEKIYSEELNNLYASLRAVRYLLREELDVRDEFGKLDMCRNTAAVELEVSWKRAFGSPQSVGRRVAVVPVSEHVIKTYKSMVVTLQAFLICVVDVFTFEFRPLYFLKRSPDSIGCEAR